MTLRDTAGEPPPQRRVRPPLPASSGSAREAEIVEPNEQPSTAQPPADASEAPFVEPLPNEPPRRSEISLPQSIPVRTAAVYRRPLHHPTAATGGAWGSLLLGVVSFLVSWFTVGGVLLAVVGVGLGVWGVSSNRRGVAAGGVILCCLSLLVGTIMGMLWSYSVIYGGTPWDAAVPAGYEAELDSL